MGKLFENVQPTIKEETKKLAIFVASCVAVMIAVFFVLSLMKPDKVPFDYTVILGGVVGGFVAVLNFFLMGITVQNVVEIKEENSAKAQMKASYMYRMFMMMLWTVLAIVLPIFQTVAGVLPLFFPGIWFKVMGIMQK